MYSPSSCDWLFNTNSLIMAKQKYDWKKGCKKLLVSALYVFIAGLAANYGNSDWYLAIAPALTYIVNYVKNK